MKLWKRGEPLAPARTLFEGKTDDVAAQAAVFHARQGTIALIERAITFFTSEYQLLAAGRRAARAAAAPGRGSEGRAGRAPLFTLRDDWTPDGAEPIGKGSP